MSIPATHASVRPFLSACRPPAAPMSRVRRCHRLLAGCLVALILSAPVHTVLSPASRIEVTGELQTADGYTWYPVTDLTTGRTGYIAAPFLTL